MQRHLLEIDEEGYPIFDGFRLDDEGLLRQMLGSIRRAVPGDLRSPLVADGGGQTVFVFAFSDPWVAQSVTLRTDGQWDWVFPGGWSQPVAVPDIKVDEWHRLHAYVGTNKVPAVLSRKAQADFLNRVDLENLAPGPWREHVKAGARDDYWTRAYEEGADRWEMGAPSPVLVEEFPILRERCTCSAAGVRVLVPGAGRGHDAVFLKNQGLAVTALDFSPYAQREFLQLYPNSGVDYQCEDAFAYLEAHPNTFTAVFEHTFFVAFDPARRREYVKAVAAALHPGGRFFGVFLTRTTPPSPQAGAYGLTQWELREYIREDFDILDWTFAWNSHPKRLGNELWVVLQKKA